jgi:hypothetical protein
VTIAPYSPAGSTGAASDAPTTPALAAPTTPTPTGPNAAGLNPTPSSVPATNLDPAIASKPLPGDVSAATPAKEGTPLDEKQLVQELASALNVKPSKGQPLEVAVVNELADKYGVPITQKGMTTAGTGTGQGAVGQIRHNIASWFDSAVSNASNAAQSAEAPKTSGASEKDLQAQYDAALKIKSPKLREQAIAKVKKERDQELNPITPAANDTTPQNQGASPATPKPVPDENTKALNDIVKQVATKMGVQGAGPNALADIAKAEGQPTAQGAAPATPATQQTAGDAFQTFVKKLNDPKTTSQFAASQVPALEAAGLLDRNATGGTKQPNGTTFTNTQIATAYQQVLQQQVQNNQSEQQALTALAASATTANAPTSEMQAYVQGVAQEFGVGLTTQQVTQIANTYGQNATTADDPASVEDEIKDAVVALYDPTNPNNPAGVADTMFTDIQQSALQYQIPISAAQIGNMVKQSLQGATVESMYVAADAAEAAATKQFQEQAKGLYPALAPQIAAGQTVQNLVAPYFNVAEAITGVPASTMMADQQGGGLSKWSAFLQGGNNPAGATKTATAPGTSTTDSAAQGGPQMMTLDQWKTYLMQTPSYGFQNTQGAKDMAEQLTSAILNEFGKVTTTTSPSPVTSLYQGQSDLSANTSSTG